MERVNLHFHQLLKNLNLGLKYLKLPNHQLLLKTYNLQLLLIKSITNINYKQIKININSKRIKSYKNNDLMPKYIIPKMYQNYHKYKTLKDQ